MSGPIIQQKDLSLSKQLLDGDPNFTPSQSWLDRWKKQHGVRLMSQESLSGDGNASEKLNKSLKISLKNVMADQIYNAN